jgi:hypothetical protein
MQITKEDYLSGSVATSPEGTEVLVMQADVHPYGWFGFTEGEETTVEWFHSKEDCLLAVANGAVSYEYSYAP